MCETNGVSAGKMLTISGNESKMTVAVHHLGPFKSVIIIIHEL